MCGQAAAASGGRGGKPVSGGELSKTLLVTLAQLLQKIVPHLQELHRVTHRLKELYLAHMLSLSSVIDGRRVQKCWRDWRRSSGATNKSASCIKHLFREKGRSISATLLWRVKSPRCEKLSMEIDSDYKGEWLLEQIKRQRKVATRISIPLEDFSTPLHLQTKGSLSFS